MVPASVVAMGIKTYPPEKYRGGRASRTRSKKPWCRGGGGRGDCRAAAWAAARMAEGDATPGAGSTAVGVEDELCRWHPSLAWAAGGAGSQRRAPRAPLGGSA